MTTQAHDQLRRGRYWWDNASVREGTRRNARAHPGPLICTRLSNVDFCTISSEAISDFSRMRFGV